jgi:hypothetical protein
MITIGSNDDSSIVGYSWYTCGLGGALRFPLRVRCRSRSQAQLAAMLVVAATVWVSAPRRSRGPEQAPACGPCWSLLRAFLPGPLSFRIVRWTGSYG